MYRFGRFTLDKRQYLLVHNAKPRSIEPHAFEVLLYLIENRDRMVTRNEIFEKLWAGKVVTDSVLGVRIRDIRRILGDTGAKQQYIKTVHGKGYQFVKPVREVILKNRTGVKLDTTDILPELESKYSDRKSIKSNIAKPSIAVLEFQIIGDEESDKYLLEGISEELQTGLSKFKNIIVIALRSSRLSTYSSSDPVAVSRELNVRYLLTGSIQTIGREKRITITLIDGESGQRIWSDLYKRKQLDILGLQEEIAARVANSLVAEIELFDRKKAQKKHTVSYNAYDCFLLGRHYFKDWRCERSDMLKSRSMFERAIEIDNEYAEAIAGLAATYARDYYCGWSKNGEEIGERSLYFARKAVELEPDNYLAHLVLAYSYWVVESDFEQAKAKLKKALHLNPNYYWNYCIGCWFSLCNGDLNQSIYQANEAILRNPLLPDDCLYTLVFSYYILKDYESAIEYFYEMNSPSVENIACLAASFAQLGKINETKQAAKRYLSLNNDKKKTKEQWKLFWKEMLKFKHSDPVEHLISGLVKADLVSDVNS